METSSLSANTSSICISNKVSKTKGKSGQLRLLCSVLFLAVVLLLASCSRPEPWETEDPVQALKAYLVALEMGQYKLAWEFLSPEDRASLEEQRDALNALDPEATREPWDFLRAGHVVATASEYAEIRVDEEASSDSELRLVVVLHDESEFEIKMLRQEGRWYVDVPIEAPNHANAQ